MKIVISFLEPVHGYYGSFETSLSWLDFHIMYGYFPRHLIANCQGETYNTRACYRETRSGRKINDFFPFYDPDENDLALRPISIFVNGQQISFDDLMDLIHTTPDHTYQRPLVWEGDPNFRAGPVAYTGKYRSRKYMVRSTGCRENNEKKLRSDVRDHSWKTQYKCRKPWMKHKRNTSINSLRNCCKKAVFDEDEALQDLA